MSTITSMSSIQAAQSSEDDADISAQPPAPVGSILDPAKLSSAAVEAAISRHSKPSAGARGNANGSSNPALITLTSSRDEPLDTSDLPPSTELLQYYRNRIHEHEKERETFLKRLSDIDVSHEELHRTQWDLRVRHEEIAELQRALSDANVYLFDEREMVLKLQAEVDQMKVQEVEDRRRIQHLLALTQPVDQSVTFFVDKRPAAMTRLPVQQTASDTRGQADAAERQLFISVTLDLEEQWP